MKALFAIIVIIVVALIAFNYTTTGKFTLIPGGATSDEDRAVRLLRGEFREAARAYLQAGRGAAISGIDTTAGAEAALREVERIEKEAKKLKRELTEDGAREALDQLLRDIAQYKRDSG